MPAFLRLAATTVLLGPAFAAQFPAWAQLPPQTTAGAGFLGAPFAAQETTIKTQTLADGTETRQVFDQLIWRDSQGRTRRERTYRESSGRVLCSIVVEDLAAGVLLKWTEGDKNPPRIAHLWPLPAREQVTAPIPEGEVFPPVSGHRSANGSTFNNLPPQLINGVLAEGQAWRRTIALDNEASHRSIEVTNELWIAPDLRIIVRHIHEDPRSGREDTEVTGLVRGEPSPALFQLPSGCQVVDHRQHAAGVQ